MFGIFKKKELKLISPMKGEVINITDVPDQVFSAKMIGDGFAVRPENGFVKSPADGKIVQIFPTNHAFGIETTEGVEILVHIGIDTVELKGEGFKRLKEVGDLVNAGDIIVEVDLSVLEASEKSTVTPVVITSKEKIKDISVTYGSTNLGEVATLDLK